MEKVADDVHASFDLAHGPLLKGVLFDLGVGRRPFLFLAAHHLVVDGVSWRILLDDLDTAYRQAVRGEAIDLGARTTSFRDWALRLEEHAAGGGFDHELDHWVRALDGGELPRDVPALPAGAPPAAVWVELSREETEALLRAAPGAYRTRINDVLLAALARALARWTGRARVSLDLEGHGREDLFDGVDLSRTVGWFTTMFPVTLDVPPEEGGGFGESSSLSPDLARGARSCDPPEEDWRGLVRSVRRQLRSVPGNGFGFGALRYLGSPAARAALSGPGPQIGFNYLGQWDARPGSGEGTGLYRAVRPSIGHEHDPAERGEHLLEVVGEVSDGVLGFSWNYHPDVHDESTVSSVAQDFADALRRIARDAMGRA
jgi:non-ribosomal peptide synthase protein (TIGR01720 family)